MAKIDHILKIVMILLYLGIISRKPTEDIKFEFIHMSLKLIKKINTNLIVIDIDKLWTYSMMYLSWRF